MFNLTEGSLNGYAINFTNTLPLIYSTSSISLSCDRNFVVASSSNFYEKKKFHIYKMFTYVCFLIESISSSCGSSLSDPIFFLPTTFVQNPYRFAQVANCSISFGETTDLILKRVIIPTIPVNIDLDQIFKYIFKLLLLKINYTPKTRNLTTGGFCHNDPHCSTNDGT